MPGNDNNPPQPESDKANQTSECPADERLGPDKTECTEQEEPKMQDSAHESTGHSRSKLSKAEREVQFENWVKAFEADPDSAWDQVLREFDAFAISCRSDQEAAINMQNTDEPPKTSSATECESRDVPQELPDDTDNTSQREQPDHPEDLSDDEKNCCQYESPDLPEDYPKDLPTSAKRLSQCESRNL